MAASTFQGSLHGRIPLYMQRYCQVHVNIHTRFSVPLVQSSGTKLVSVSSLQSTSVTVTVDGTADELYSCTMNKQVFNVTAGQPVQRTGLAPDATYTVNCHHVDDSCLETKVNFTTGAFVTPLR